MVEIYVIMKESPLLNGPTVIGQFYDFDTAYNAILSIMDDIADCDYIDFTLKSKIEVERIVKDSICNRAPLGTMTVSNNYTEKFSIQKLFILTE